MNELDNESHDGLGGDDSRPTTVAPTLLATEEGPPVGSRRAAVSGVLAAAVALGVGELLAGASSRIASLVVAVGDQVINNVPGSIERWAIRTLGENDKPALVIGIVVISLIIGAFTGIAAAKKFRTAVTVFAVFAIIGGLATSADAQSSAMLGWLSAAVAAIAGLFALRFMLAAARTGNAMPVLTNGRRTFVGAASAAAAVSVVTPLVGTLLRSRRAAEVEADRDNVAAVIAEIEDPVPTAVPESTPETVNAGTEAVGQANYDDVEGISMALTPSDEFYRIDSALVVPKLDVATWSMRVTGMVDTEVELTFDDLLDMDPIEEVVTMSCVSNRVGGDLVGTARWLGVPLKKVLDMAGVDPAATQIVGRSVDGWTGGFPTSYLDDPDRVALIAVAMNGEPLPLEHGFPVRLVIAGLYGYVSATKWLKEIELTTWDDFDGYWITRGWSKLGPVKTQSRIDVPRQNSTVEGPDQVLAGVAWAPDRGVDRVEVQVSPVEGGNVTEGPWQEAMLSDDVSDNAWRQWYLPWEAPPGDYGLRVRATDGDGITQTEERAEPAPSGATGWHTIFVRVK